MERQRQREGESRKKKQGLEVKMRGLERREAPGDQVVQPATPDNPLCISFYV